MRLNKLIAYATGMARRAADAAISDGRVEVNGKPATIGQDISAADHVSLDGRNLAATHSATSTAPTRTIMLNKPVGYVVSRNGQGSPTIYELLPAEYHNLKPVGRLDKDSSGLLLLTNDGELAHQLTHPSFQKEKVYRIELNKPLAPEDKAKLEQGIKVDDYISRLRLFKVVKSKAKTVNGSWEVAMTMGRNRQIRRTFAALGYQVTRLHRTSFGPYVLGDLRSAEHAIINGRELTNRS